MVTSRIQTCAAKDILYNKNKNSEGRKGHKDSTSGDNECLLQDIESLHLKVVEILQSGAKWWLLKTS